MRDPWRLPTLASCVSLVALALSAACSAPTFDEPKTGINAVQIGGEMSGYRFDPATIDSAYVVGDILHLHLSYGGCGTHAVALLQTGPFMESFPVQVLLSLAHDARGEACRMLVRSQERFDLTALKESYRTAYRSSGTILLRVRAPGPTPAVTSVYYQFR